MPKFWRRAYLDVITDIRYFLIVGSTSPEVFLRR